VGLRKALTSKSLPAMGKATTAAAIRRAMPTKRPRKILVQMEPVVALDSACGTVELGVN
jgi:hypothetical protein